MADAHDPRAIAAQTDAMSALIGTTPPRKAVR